MKGVIANDLQLAPNPLKNNDILDTCGKARDGQNRTRTEPEQNKNSSFSEAA
jgi:hypothetical protein